MNDIKMWEKENKYFVYFNNVKEYVKYLIDNNLSGKFFLQSKYTSGDKEKDFIERLYNNDSKNIIFTDKSHPIAASGSMRSRIDPIFFNEHKDEFIKYYKLLLDKQLEDSKRSFIDIFDFSIDEETLYKIIDKYYTKDIYISYYKSNDKTLSSEVRKKLENKHINFYILNVFDINKIEFVSNKAFFNYSFNDLSKLKSISFDMFGLNEQEFENLNNLKYLNPSAKIIINYGNNNIKDEKNYFDNINKILDILSRHDNKYNIQINVDNRETFRQSGIIQKKLNNINLFINNDNYVYSFSSYLKEEKKLDKLIEPIKKADLSPFEKYIAVYNIVKQFKPYKENEDDPIKARSLHYILNNDYMVCVGYAKLLETLLDEVNIPCKCIDTSVDNSYYEGFTMDETIVSYEGHSRNLVYINDDKYNIHGYYIADATWDNFMNQDIYLNSLLTFDRKKEAFAMEKLESIDLLFDFHNMEDFRKKISYYIKSKTNGLQYNYAALDKYNIITKEKYEEKFYKQYYNAYNDLFEDVLTILCKLDYDKYEYFFTKYNKKFDKFNNITEADKIFNEFLHEYYKYIITRVNNKIEDKSIIEAASVVKSKINKLSLDEINDWLLDTSKYNEERRVKDFPYRYDSNFKESYLETAYNKEDKKIK